MKSIGPVSLVSLWMALGLASCSLAGPGAVVLRGSLAASGVSRLQYVADLETLGEARYAGIDGQGIMAEHGKQLRTQAEFYAAAQRATRGEATSLTPLYVILDPSGDWAYAQSYAQISYLVNGKSSGEIKGPVLLLGEKRSYRAGATGVGPRSKAFNAEIRSLAGEFYRSRLQQARKSGGDLDEEVLSKSRLILDGTEKVDMIQAGDRLSEATYVKWLGQVVAQGLDRKKLPGEALWKEFEIEVGLEERMARQSQISVVDQVATSISHEMGHLVHFMAVGPRGFSLGGSPPHMNGNSHTFQTLSTPEFALVEGWAAANSMVTLGLPEPVSSPGKANRIDYGTSVVAVDKKLNQGLATLAARAATRLKVLPEGKPLQVPAYDTPPEQFRTELEESLLQQGFQPTDWQVLLAEEAVSPEMVQLTSAQRYLNQLQDSKGELRGRYDFLRSEFAVGSALAALRLSLGQEDGWLILQTMARHRPLHFADLVEKFVHDHPRLRARIYQELARITEGILVTPEQAAEVSQRPELEIDLDRDGVVPGKSATKAIPALFPVEAELLTGTRDPLSWSGTKSKDQIFTAEVERAGHGLGEQEPRSEWLGLEGSFDSDPGPNLPGMDGLFLR